MGVNFNNSDKKLNSNYISGLSQSDGSFFVVFSKESRYKHGIRIRPKFVITQDLDSKVLLEEVQKFFGCGKIVIYNNKHAVEFVVDSLTDLNNIIIPHFKNFPVFEGKQQAFLIMDLIVKKLMNKDHYDKNQLGEIIKLGFSMNKVSNRDIIKEKELFELLQIEYIETIPFYPEIKNYPLNEHFLIGLIEGDGSFFISFKANKKIVPGFHITQEISSLNLFNKIPELLGCGYVNENSSNEIRYLINDFKSINSILIPFIDKYMFYSEKAEHYRIFKEVCSILDNDKTITKDMFLYIVDLAYNMNKDGKRRRLSKQEFLSKYVETNTPFFCYKG